MRQLITLTLVLVTLSSFSQCDEPTAGAWLNINNVEAWIQNGQSMWEQDGFPGYNVPKTEKAHSAYAHGLWVGGVDPSQQLKLAGGTYNFGGSDFYPGPLSMGDAVVNSETCEGYDYIWILYRAEVESHLAYFDCFNDPSCEVELEYPSGYSVPDVFFTYPAHGDVSLGQALYLAPFYDYDGDGIYDPTVGDCPLWDFILDDGCTSCDALHGDMCLYWIDNDKGGFHSATTGVPIGLEIHNMAYAYASAGVLDHTTFYQKKIINRGTQTLTDSYVGLWTDGDLGDPTDDYVGCDIDRNLGYMYNGDSMDGDNFTSVGYGENPPAFGLDLLQGPTMDADGVDQDGDGVTDNETHGLTNFMFHTNSLGVQGDPSQANEYFALLKSLWLNGAHLVCGGNGLDSEGESTNWAYAGDTSDLDPCDDWTESTAGNPPGDRRFIVSSGPFTLEPGDEHCISYSAIWARPHPESGLDAVETLQLSSDTIAGYLNDCFACVPPGVAIMSQQVDNFTYSFSNYAQGSIVEWDFGDGSTSTEENPTHTFDGEGEFEITLTVSSECGETTGSTTISSVALSTEHIEPFEFSIGPNPVADMLFINAKSDGTTLVKVIDSIGREVLRSTLPQNGELDLSHIAKGQYIIQISEIQGARQWTEKLIKL